MLATIDDETARRLADDIRRTGAAYVRIELGGKATRIDPLREDETFESFTRRTFE